MALPRRRLVPATVGSTRAASAPGTAGEVGCAGCCSGPAPRSWGKVLELTLDVARARQMKRVAAEGWRIETV